MRKYFLQYFNVTTARRAVNWGLLAPKPPGADGKKIFSKIRIPILHDFMFS